MCIAPCREAAPHQRVRESDGTDLAKSKSKAASEGTGDGPALTRSGRRNRTEALWAGSADIPDSTRAPAAQCATPGSRRAPAGDLPSPIHRAPLMLDPRARSSLGPTLCARTLLRLLLPLAHLPHGIRLVAVPGFQLLRLLHGQMLPGQGRRKTYTCAFALLPGTSCHPARGAHPQKENRVSNDHHVATPRPRAVARRI